MFSFATQELLILYSTPVYLIIILFEIFFSNLNQRNWYTIKDTLHNIYLMVLNSSIDLFFRAGYVVLLSYFWQYKLLVFENKILYWVVLVLAIDFMFYWMHRMEHSIRLFWAVHVTHHSSEKFNFSVGFRSSVFQPLYRFFFFIPLALSGFQPIDILLIYSACQIWGILVHTEMIHKLGWVEYILVTPSHHRVHHASNPLYLDKNLGMFLIVWDKMFGTFQEELAQHDYQVIRYGLTTVRDLSAPLSVVLHEWQDMIADLKKDISNGDKLNYLFGPPGWSHDGSRHTSEELRAMESFKSTDNFRTVHSHIANVESVLSK